MFFNQDILFRNGSLALVWKTGNGEFTTKRSRGSKEYRSILKCNLIMVCKDLRGLLHLMGTAHGMSLKNMATLVKGAGTIYQIKIDQFARDVYAAMVQMKKPINLLDSKTSNTMPEPKKGMAKKNTVATDNYGLADGVDVGQAVEFGNLCVENFFGSPRAIPTTSRLSENSPRHFPALLMDGSPTRSAVNGQEQRTPMRRRHDSNEEAMYQNVIKRLRMELAGNPRANCLLDDEGILPPPPPPERDHPDLDFGDGLDFINNANQMLNDGELAQVPILQEQPEELMCPSPSVTTTLLGPPSRIELDMRGTVLETPAGARTEPINQRRALGRQLDTSFIELENLQQDRRKRLGTKAKKRLFLDREIVIPFPDMLARVRAEINIDTLMSQLEKNRAPGKSTWKIHCMGQGIDFIRSAGQNCPSAILQDMTNDILKNQALRRVSSIEISSINPDCEAELIDTAVTAGGRSEATLQDAQGNQLRDPEPPILELDEQMVVDHDVIVPAETNMNEELQPPASDVILDESGRGLRTRKDVEDRIRSKLYDNLESTPLFHVLFPPATKTRKEASLAFFTMLKMQAKKEIHIHQSFPYGPITIERMNSSTQE